MSDNFSFYFLILFKHIQDTMFKFDKKNHKIELLSQNWEQPLGQYCRTCRVRLKTAECISACGCLLFCHEQCFVQQMSPYITIDSQVRCLRCDRVIQFTMKHTAFWVCNRRPAYILAVIGALMILVGSYLMISIGFYREVVEDKVAYGILSGGAVILLAAIIKTSRRKVVKVSDVRVIDTKMLGKNQTEKGLMSKTKHQQSRDGKGKLHGVTESKVDFEGQYEMM